MRSRSLIWFALVSLLLQGCALKETKRYVGWIPGFRHFESIAGDDVVGAQVALIEAPVGDRALNGALWTLTDEEFLSLEALSVLDENGFRVGKVSSSPPSELLDLLTSKKSCPNPRRLQGRAGKPLAPIVLGPERAEMTFHLSLDETGKDVTLSKAEVTFEIVPIIAKNGRTKLKITPQIRNGSERRQLWKPKDDRSGWMMQLTQPKKTYKELSWEVTLNPGQYLIIGGQFDRPGSLGHETFVRRDESPPVQRLLVIRALNHAASSNKADKPLVSVSAKPPSMKPLALQAGGE